MLATFHIRFTQYVQLVWACDGFFPYISNRLIISSKIKNQEYTGLIILDKNKSIQIPPRYLNWMRSNEKHIISLFPTHRLAVAFSKLIMLKSHEGSSSSISNTSGCICDSKLLGMWIWWPDTENKNSMLKSQDSTLFYDRGIIVSWHYMYYINNKNPFLPGLLWDTLLLSWELVMSCRFTFCWKKTKIHVHVYKSIVSFSLLP